MKPHRTLKLSSFSFVSSLIVILSMLLSLISAPPAFAQSGNRIRRQVNAESGKLSFIGPESGRAVAAAQALGTSLRPQDPAMALARRFGPEFGLQNPQRDLSTMKSHRAEDGRVMVRYQQHYQGIPIMGGELLVNTNDNGDLYSMNGEISQNLSIFTEPTIDSAQARTIALQAMAKWYKKGQQAFIVSEPELWIFDESLLLSSTRPAELVWRMEITPKDDVLPVRELVLVNAQRGGVSLHFNQMDTAWTQSRQDVPPTPTSEPPQPIATPMFTGIPDTMAVPLPENQNLDSQAVLEATTMQPLTANNWYVTTTGSNAASCATTATPCASINGALSKAAAGDTIYVSTGLYQGSAATLIDVTKSITILGGWNSSFNARTGYSILDGTGNNSGLFHIQNNTVLERLVLRNATRGAEVTNGTTCPIAVSLTLRQSTVMNMSNGGLRSCGTLIIENSTITNNRGIGISNFTGTVNIKNSTIIKNTSDGWGQGVGGGIDTLSGTGTVTLQNTILTGNTGYGEAPQDCSGTPTSNGNNIIGTTTSCYPTLQSSDKIGIDPKLGPPLPNGYYPLFSGSPAIDSGASCLSIDQRGVVRPQGVACDIGSYEYATPGNVVVLAIVSGNSQRTAPNYTFRLPLTIAPLDSQDNLVPNVNVNFSAPGSGASAIFASTGSNSASIPSNANGLAIASISANGQLGSYNATASATGAGTMNFNLQNSALFVAPGGSNANSCTVPASPCATMNGAISKAVTDDVILVAAGTYTGTEDEVVLIDKGVMLVGGWNNTFSTQNGTSIIDGQGIRRGVSMISLSPSVLDRFTIQNGNNIQGGGIMVAYTTMTINNAMIQYNTAGVSGSGPYGGGGIDNSGTLTLNNSTIHSNIVISGFEGGGIHNSGTLIMNNSTVSGNIGGDGAIYNDYKLFLNNSTVTRNRPYGIHNLNGTVTMQNSIVANNGPNGDCYNHPYYSGIIISQGYNLIGQGEGCSLSAATGDLIGTNTNLINPRLAILQDNGGPTWTHALMAGSPAIDAGNPASPSGGGTACLITDQRGTFRPVSSRCDMGAYEGSVAATSAPLIETYTTDNTYNLPGTFLCNEVDPTCFSGDSHAKSAHKYAMGTYNLYASKYARNSIDGKGMVIKSTVHYCSPDPDMPCPYPNASWTGAQMVYGDAYGFALADDIVAHELTHGVTQYESNLFYAYQSGAINESFSDVWGEYYDQTNGQGNDASAVKWLLGEDVSGLGALRSMSNPPAYNDPDRMTSAYYQRLPYEDDNWDNGGVHTNSGVNNKAAFLMVDGGTFNGKTVTGLGWEKVGAIYYEVNTNLLTSGADYSDLYYALQQACNNLIGQKGITGLDCAEVKDAVDAVEMNGQPVPNFNTDAPVCNAGQTPSLVFADDLENGTGYWSFTNGAYPRWQYDSFYYGYYAQSGSHALHAEDYPDEVTDAKARLTAITIPANAYLWFAQAYEFESYASGPYAGNYDGGVLEYNVYGTSTWLDAGSLMQYNGYRGVIYNGVDGDNPLHGRNAFVGSSHGYISTRVNLATLAGKTVFFRWRMGLDTGNYFGGWWVDNVKIYTCNPLQTPAISGNAGVSGVTLSYADGTPKSVTSDANGNYSLQVNSGWTGTVTASHPCYTFSPANRPYSNIISNQLWQNFTPAYNSNPDCPKVNVDVGTTLQGQYIVPIHGSVRQAFTNLDNGPAKIASTNGTPILASERFVYSFQNSKSYAEMMGYPGDQLATEYWFPWYNNISYSTQLRVSNMGNNSAQVSVYAANALIDTFMLSGGQGARKSYAGLDSGPLHVVSTDGTTPILASERFIQTFMNSASYAEMMGYPGDQLATEYWFPWYNNLSYSTQLRVSNLGGDNAEIKVYAGLTEIDSFMLQAGQGARKSYAVDSGPLHVVSVDGTTPILASERFIQTFGTSASYAEMMGYPGDQLTTEYCFPWYNTTSDGGVLLSSQLRVSNMSGGDIQVKVSLAGLQIDTFALASGLGARKTYSSSNNGPLCVMSTDGVSPILASERFISTYINSASYSEMMGYPTNKLASSYWFPWYNNNSYSTEFRIAKP